ncbi:MAG: hypothetical protein LEGION0403_FIIPPAGN_02260 [Legionella sp.]
MSSLRFVYPKVKPFVEFCWRNGIVSFFKIPGLSINLNDEAKFIYNVCCMMDGATHLDVLKEKISLIYPTESQFIEDLLTVLDNEYLIEDSFYTSVDDKERWSKNTEFFGSYCRANENKYQKQKSLSTIKVSILGLGGVGSNVLLNLAALGVQNFRIVDFDEAIPVIITEEQQPIETQTETITYTRTKKNTGRKPLPQSLSYIEHVYDLSDEEKLILIKKNTKEKFRYLFLINFLSI